MKLKISHVTEYTYGNPVTDSVNEIRLTPCTDHRQSCYQHSIAIEPNAGLMSYEDYFGNRVHAFSVNDAHRKLTIRSSMTVETKSAQKPFHVKTADQDADWRWLESEEVLDRFAEYLLPTVYTATTPEVIAFAEESQMELEKPGVYEWLNNLSERIRTEFVYDPHATDVQTKVSDMIGTRRGVCQDFAHLMIAICRASRIPARYVSGYHFIGDLQGRSPDFEHASHAWIEAFVPGRGWCSFDPTNAEQVGERYVKLGHGRDYKDIVPVKGVYRGTGVQTLNVTVDVQQLTD